MIRHRACLLIISAFFFVFALTGTAVTARAEAVVPDLMYSNVLDDLSTSSINGVAFNEGDYTASPGDPAELITLTEFCYSHNKSDTRYGLYLYIYNPSAHQFSKTSIANKVQLGTEFGADGNVIEYVKYGLQFISKSDNGLFYKFKVIDTGGKLLAHLGAVRCYEVSGFELFTAGAINAVEYPAKYSYTYTGYAEGCGADPALDTLQCSVKELEVLELDVRHTFFRTGVSDKGADHQNQLDSVYFSVPDEVLNKYGRLQRIKAEWYEYKTKEIVVTSNTEFYNAALPYVGKYIDPNIFYSAIGRSLFYNKSLIDLLPSRYVADWGWNIGEQPVTVSLSGQCNYLQYLFSAKDIQSYDPYGTAVMVGGVQSNELAKYIYQYDKSFRNGRLPVKDGLISADLFESAVDTGRTRGYNVREFDADIDVHQMMSYSSTKPSFWDKVKTFGFWSTVFPSWSPEHNDNYTNIPPILPVTDKLLSDTPEEPLLVRNEDRTALAAYRTAAQKEKETTFLFRFATTEYFSGALSLYNSKIVYPAQIDGQAYMAQETVFLDFDIIHLTFERDSVYHVMPVVHSPFDIIPDITPPVDMPKEWNAWDWLKTILGAVLGILLIVVLVIVLTASEAALKIVKIILKIIFFPITLIVWIVKKSKQKKSGGISR